MTLGGLAIAIDSSFYDVIVDTENAYRCLHDNKYCPHPPPVLEVVFASCKEVRDSVFSATVITIL